MVDNGMCLRRNFKEKILMSAQEDWDDEDFVTEMILKANDRSVFLEASERLKDKKDFVLFLMENAIHVFPFISARLKDDEEVVSAELQKRGSSLCWVSERLRDDKKMIEIALNKNGWALEYASKRLKDDKDVVLMALNKNGMALEYASERLKSDLSVVLTAVKEDGYAIDAASKDLVAAFNRWLGKNDFKEARAVSFVEQIIYREKAEEECEILNSNLKEVKELSRCGTVEIKNKKISL